MPDLTENRRVGGGGEGDFPVIRKVETAGTGGKALRQTSVYRKIFIGLGKQTALAGTQLQTDPTGTVFPAAGQGFPALCQLIDADKRPA